MGAINVMAGKRKNFIIMKNFIYICILLPFGSKAPSYIGIKFADGHTGEYYCREHSGWTDYILYHGYEKQHMYMNINNVVTNSSKYCISNHSCYESFAKDQYEDYKGLYNHLIQDEHYHGTVDLWE